MLNILNRKITKNVSGVSSMWVVFVVVAVVFLKHSNVSSLKGFFHEPRY